MVGAICNSLSYIVASPFMALWQMFGDKMGNHRRSLAEVESRTSSSAARSASVRRPCWRMCSDQDLDPGVAQALRPEVPFSLRKYCTSSEKPTTYPFVRDRAILPAAAVGEENIAGGRYTRPQAVINVPKLHTLSEPRFRALLTEGASKLTLV